MKILITIFLSLALFFFFPTDNYHCSAADIDWVSLQKAFKEYADYPSPENSTKVLNILPDKKIDYQGSRKGKEARAFIYHWEQFNMLERQVLSKDRFAVKIAFRLIHISDGSFTEHLCIMLGTLIRIDPKLFLEELKSSNLEPLLLGSLLGNEGDVYVDRIRAQCLENQLRIKSLENVKESSLDKIRNKCVEVLKEHYTLHCN